MRWLLSLLFAVELSCGAEYTLDWWTIDSGGQVSSDGNYEIVGTIGQPDTSVVSSGEWQISGGFWQNGPTLVAPAAGGSLIAPTILPSSITLTNTFAFRALLEKEKAYRVQSSANWIDWITRTNFVSESEIFDFAEAKDSAYQHRFYRIVSP